MCQRRYPSDTTHAEWALIEPLLPEPACETRTGGRSEKHPRREIVDAIRYVVDTGCKWRALPADFLPWRTVWGFMARWAACGVMGQIRDHLSGQIRREMGKGPRAVATAIDSQSVRAAETVGRDSRGYDAGKKINGRKRHLVVDTRGLPLPVMITPASPTDRGAAKELPLPLPPHAPRDHHLPGRLHLRRKARDLGSHHPHDPATYPAKRGSDPRVTARPVRRQRVTAHGRSQGARACCGVAQPAGSMCGTARPAAPTRGLTCQLRLIAFR